MIEGLEPVALQELRVLGAPRHWSVEGHLDQLPSLTPVRGELRAEHRGNVLMVEGKLSTIVTLSCDRCLGQFNHELTCTSTELIWLGQAPPTEDDLQNSEHISEMEGLVEYLDPRGDFDPQQWVFEQLNLQLPVVNHWVNTVRDPASVPKRWSGTRLSQLTPDGLHYWACDSHDCKHQLE